MIYHAPYPAPGLYPASTVYPATPTPLPAGQAWLVGTNGTAVAVRATVEMSGTRNSNTTVRPTANGDAALVDLATWSPRIHQMTILLPDYATYRYVEDLYRSGAIVTLNDPGSPWDSTQTILVGAIGYRAITLPGRGALIEMTLEVAEQ